MSSTAPNREQFARKMLDRLIELDYSTVEAYYEMGSIISSMLHGKLFEIIGYGSMSELIEEELSFTANTGLKYGQMYRHFRRLKYSKQEAVGLLQKFGLTHMVDVLPRMTDKIGDRAIRERIKRLDQHQVNFTLSGAELKKAEAALEKMGAQKSDLGRWLHSSDAFMRMVEKTIKR